MGIITQIKQIIVKRRESPKSQVSEEIEQYIQTEKQKQRIDAMMNYERNSFLYGKGNEYD